MNNLDAKLAFLRQPGSYPDPTKRVDVIETHMSWVFLTDHFVYKLKKPVQLPFLDFSTLELRKHFCEEEIRLNLRLAPKVYLETIAITAAPGNGFSLGDKGVAVDWLVKMKRLPTERMMNYAIMNRTIDDKNVVQIAAMLAKFYQSASPIDLTAAEYKSRFMREVFANFVALAESQSILPREEVNHVHNAQLTFLGSSPSLLEERAAQRHIIEAHGDLRPEHVFLGPEPQIIDCLEFNFDYRCLDPVDELCFLSMECEMLGAPEIGRIMLDEYCRLSDDCPPSSLLDFYKCHRACLRSKLSFWHLRDLQIREPERWPIQARAYLKLAGLYADRLVTTLPSS